VLIPDEPLDAPELTSLISAYNADTKDTMVQKCPLEILQFVLHNQCREKIRNLFSLHQTKTRVFCKGCNTEICLGENIDKPDATLKRTKVLVKKLQLQPKRQRKDAFFVFV
jgi:hypothetical protein